MEKTCATGMNASTKAKVRVSGRGLEACPHRKILKFGPLIECISSILEQTLERFNKTQSHIIKSWIFFCFG